MSNFDPSPSSEVTIEMELFFQLQSLVTGISLPASFPFWNKMNGWNMTLFTVISLSHEFIIDEFVPFLSLLSQFRTWFFNAFSSLSILDVLEVSLCLILTYFTNFYSVLYIFTILMDNFSTFLNLLTFFFQFCFYLAKPKFTWEQVFLLSSQMIEPYFDQFPLIKTSFTCFKFKN